MATFAVVIGNVHSVVCVCGDGNDKWSKVCSLYCNTVYICTKQISEEQPHFLKSCVTGNFFAFSLPLYYPTQNIISHSDLFLPPSIHKPRLQTAENKGNLYCGFKECPWFFGGVAYTVRMSHPALYPGFFRHFPGKAKQLRVRKFELNDFFDWVKLVLGLS